MSLHLYDTATRSLSRFEVTPASVDATVVNEAGAIIDRWSMPISR